jgi:hypothetical protein
MVFDRFKASDRLADWAEENGGYFTWKSDEQVTIRVPDEKVVPFRSFLESFSDQIIQYDLSALDLREDLMFSRSALAAREEILAKNISYLASSDVEGTLELEQEIRRLMTEIDGYRGLIRRMEHDRKMAMIEVSLSFRQQTIPDYLPSSFTWVNSVDFYDFMNSGMSARGSDLFQSALIDLPEGFALVDKGPEYKALSPEGVRLRVRKADNYPEQSLDFWIKTLEADLRNRGYLVFESKTEQDWGRGKNFAQRLWALPLGNEDYLFLTALHVSKGKIEILEMAGQAEYMLKYLGK